MKIALGSLEHAILLACLAHQRPAKEDDAPDLYRDELPGLLWGWRGQDRCRSLARPWNREPQTYPDIPAREYRAKQATLTRALQTLYQKGLIDAGNTHEATDLHIYSPRRAAALGIEPARPRTEAEMTEVHYTKFGADLGIRPWSYKSTGQKPRMGRNIKAIRLTELGVLVVRQLQVKSQNRSGDLTRIIVEVEPPPPPPPLTEAEQEARRQVLADAEAVIAGRPSGRARA